jgi:hypothetical protein
MKSIAFTIVLNGMPFIKKQYDIIPKVFDEWHIIEGATHPVYDTNWCKNIKTDFYNNEKGEYYGCSTDGTSEFLDSIKSDKIFVYRKGDLWNGKNEMCRQIEPFMENCVLMQFDVDEIWNINVLREVIEYTKNELDVDGMLFHCNYYVGPDLMIVNENCYGNYHNDWSRLWKITDKTTWKAHEPPRINGLIKFLNRDFTKNRNWIFDHYSYVLPEQLKFKENFYGYSNAFQCWTNLQNNSEFPCLLRNYLPWVKDDAIVIKLDKNEIQNIHSTL